MTDHSAGRDDGLDLAHSEFAPDPELTHDEMEELQRSIATAATFEDEIAFDAADVAIEDAYDISDTVPDPVDPEHAIGLDTDAPVVVGVDQAFLEDEVVSAIVALQDGAIIERTHAVSPLSIPYIPGLLAFREGGPILDAFETLSVDPDLAVFDGSGRIHYRQAGIATHIGVTLDLPAVGVAKSLLCGEPDESVDERPEGWATPIRADDEVEAPNGTVLGHAFQSRQYPNSRRMNPLYVSPGHRVSAETNLEIVEALTATYKLPVPTRLADAYADQVKRSYTDG
ncbi:endonuclease V [Haloparvum sp. PAK95]|uniref:endonuclease V n=1 Tax=Haloparvum sp. PAK95 TaxID=3418962 RepID=UPI003D2EC8E2